MKSNDPDLIAHLLENTEFIVAELFTFELLSGEVLRYTDADIDITHSGVTWLAAPLEITRGEKRTSIGFEVDDVPLEIISDGTAILNGFSLQRLMQLGFLERALVTIEKLYLQQWGVQPPWDPFVDFYGRWSSDDIGELRCKAEVKWGEEFHQPWPKRHVGAGCPYVVFDDDCTLDREAFRVNGVCEAGTTVVKLYAPATLGASPAGYFPLGYVKITSGVMNGLTMSIKSQGPGYVVLDAPLLFTPAVGTTFAAYPGCDLTKTTCNATFANLANYGGQPNVPVPETAI